MAIRILLIQSNNNTDKYYNLKLIQIIIVCFIEELNLVIQMHRILLRNVPPLISKTPLLHQTNLLFTSGYQKQPGVLKASLNDSTGKIKLSMCPDNCLAKKQSQIQLNKLVYPVFNQQSLINFTQPTIKKQSLKFSQQKVAHATDATSNRQQSSKNPSSSLKWFHRLILIAFITKLLQQDGYRCDYDINDMMITIELEQRLLAQQEDNAEQQGSYAAKENKQKKHKARRSSIKQAGNTKDERYGTVEEMLKDQMSSSEDFNSVEERLYIKDIQGKRDQQKQNAEKTQQTQKQQPQQNYVQHDIANHIFRQEQVPKAQPNTYDKHSEIIAESPKQNQLRILSQEIQGHLSAIEQPNSPVENKNDKVQTHKESNEDKISQQTIHQTLNDTENTVTIYLESQIMQPLSKSIQNFLKLRGITINFQHLPSSFKTQSKQIKESLKIRLCNKLADCKDILFKPQHSENRDVFHHINNFLNPPHIINTVEEAKSLLDLLHEDESIVGSYIPATSPQFQAHQQKPVYDTFSARNPPVNPSLAEKDFNQYKYLSSSRKNCFIILRNEQTAKYLKIPTNKIGVPHILFKHDKELNGKQSEPNCKIDGEFYHAIGNVDRMIQKQKLDSVQKVAQKINSLTERGFTQTNVIEDVSDKIRQLSEQVNGFSFTGESKKDENHTTKKQKKLFVVKTGDPQSEQQINQILQKLSKMNKNEVSILKTQSETLLKSLKIFNNEEYACIRLFDLENNQQPIVREQNFSKTEKGYFQRYIPNGPFQVQFLSRWISNLSPFDKAHIQNDKSINRLKSSYPNDLQVRQEGHTKLVLFYKEGCKGCKLMQDLLGHLKDVLQRLAKGDTQSANHLRKEICLRYMIQDPQVLSRLQISKFNILNDDDTIEVPQTTPTIHLFNQKNTQKHVIKTEQVFNQLKKIKNGNDQVVHDYMMRELIEEIQRNIKKMDNVV